MRKQTKAYKQLIKAFITLERALYTGQLSPLSMELQYKFFTKLLLLIAYQREFLGANIKEALRQLRLALKVDYRYERQFSSFLIRSWIEMVSIALVLSLFFYLIQAEMPELRVAWGEVVLFWGIGGGLFWFASYGLQKMILEPFNSLFYGLYYLLLQLEVAVDIHTLFSHPVIISLIRRKNRRFEHLPLLLEDLLMTIKQGGDYDREQIRALLELSGEIYEQNLEKFYRGVGGVKFFILAIFFLGSYLYHLVHILSSIEQF